MVTQSKRDKYGAEVTSLSLKFLVTKKHFVHGLLRLKCTAKVARLFVMSNNVEESDFDEQVDNNNNNSINVINNNSMTKEARNTCYPLFITPLIYAIMIFASVLVTF